MSAKKKEITLRKPYQAMIDSAKHTGRYRIIEGDALENARHRINSRADEKISRIENLERLARIKSAGHIIK